MQKNEKGSNVIKPNYCLSSKSAVGLFLFSFFEAKSLLEASHRLAANYYITATKVTQNEATY